MTNLNTLELNSAVAAIVAASIPAKKAAKKPAKKATAPFAAHIKAMLTPIDSDAAAIIKAAAIEAPKAMLGSFELNDGIDAEAAKLQLCIAASAIQSISDKDGQLLEAYLSFGSFQSIAATWFKSTKLYGQFVAVELPLSATLDPALRSNCKWLFEALNVKSHDAADLLSILQINRIADFKSGNPTVIRREYKAAKAADLKKQMLREVAADNGVSEEQAEAIAEGEAHDAKLKAEKAAKSALAKMLKRMTAMLAQNADKDDAIAEAVSLMAAILAQPQKDQMSFLDSLV